MEIWRGQFHVSQARNLEHIHVPLVPGYIETAQVGFCNVAAIGEVRRHDPQLLIHVSTDSHPLVATGATEGFEELVTFLLAAGESRTVVAEVSVESRVRRR